MRRIVMLVAALAVIAPSPALADDLPDMLGEWTGTSRAVVAGAGGHYGDGPAEARFVEADLTIEWTQQDDDRLIGTITSTQSTEPKLGVLSSDGTTMVTVDSDGASIGRMIDDDHFELCYMQTSLGDDQMVASCVEFERSGT